MWNPPLQMPSAVFASSIKVFPINRGSFIRSERFWRQFWIALSHSSSCHPSSSCLSRLKRSSSNWWAQWAWQSKVSSLYFAVKQGAGCVRFTFSPLSFSMKQVFAFNHWNCDGTSQRCLEGSNGFVGWVFWYIAWNMKRQKIGVRALRKESF